MRAAIAGLESETWQDICRFDDLIENVGVCALVADCQIAIFRLSGFDGVYAIDNHDPFSDANVISRGIVGDIRGEPVVASPIYKQHFNLLTGQCLEDDSVRLSTHPARVQGGVVQVARR